MDIKSAFLNGVIEEVFVKQPSGFEDLKNPDHVFKLKKSLYGLKQVPKAWYDRLSNFQIKNDFKRGQVDTTLFRQEESMIGLLSVIEPNNVDEALSDDGWILAMQEELN